MYSTKRIIKALPVHIINPRINQEDSINVGEEFESLIDTFGARIEARSLQKLDRPFGATYIGTGKINEIAGICADKKIDVVILDAAVKPGQLHAISEILRKKKEDIEVWDRVELILRIFEKHASTTEAKLQIELAKMNYMGPRIYGMGFVLSRQGGGIGTTGIGETNTELMKRHWRNEKKRITDQLEKINKSHAQQIDRRRESGLKTVSIVGYTNAGKSTLFNKLSHKQKLEKDELFATLDSSVGKLYLNQISTEVLVSDTIGFIRNLPPLLISAFKSTLMESVHSDITLHVIDASDKEMETKIKVVNEILSDLGVVEDNIIYVFNKIDAVPDLNIQDLKEKYSKNSPIFVSAKSDENISEITNCLVKKLN